MLLHVKYFRQPRMKFPNGVRAVVDIEKLRDYCLSAQQPEGRHKARVSCLFWEWHPLMLLASCYVLRGAS